MSEEACLNKSRSFLGYHSKLILYINKEGVNTYANENEMQGTSNKIAINAISSQNVCSAREVTSTIGGSSHLRL